MRAYEQSHPWISFRFDPRQLPGAVWVRLGEASALATHLRGAALPVKEGALFNYIATLQGVVANAALHGNTLSEDQVDRLLEGSLQLPPSYFFMEREVRNLLKAVAWAEARVKAGDRDTGPWALQVLNAQVMKELTTGTVPGEYRGVRDPNPAGGVLPEDIPVVLQRLQEWLAGPLFNPGHEEERLPLAIIAALLGHLYLRWTAPFPGGNGRTARLLEFQLLVQAGLPPVAAHRMAIHAAATRAEYERQFAHATRPGGDPIPFIAHMVQGFAEELKQLSAEVDQAQYQHLAQEELRAVVDLGEVPAAERLLTLATAIHEQEGKVTTAEIPLLSPEVARFYARLTPKTLQRDLAQLEKLGLVLRSRGAVKAKPPAVRPFQLPA